jgi:hypothetical protein
MMIPKHSKIALLLVIMCFPVTLFSAEPHPKTKFPTSLLVVEQERPSASKFTVRLASEPGVDVYAHEPRNDVWNHTAATLVIRDVNGEAVNATIEYPEGVPFDTGFVGDLYVYRESIDIDVTVTDASPKHPLTLTLTGAGYNRLRSFCLGKMRLTATRN